MMANPEHLSFFSQGVNTWNEWRKAHPVERIDLSGLDARGLDLKGIVMPGANLMNADFSGADLSGIETWLQNTNLNNAVLRGTNLSRAEMQGANLYQAKLDDSATVMFDTSLMSADVSYADFSGANLEKVKINDARAWHAKFAATNLQRAHLWGTDFREAVFTGANLKGANLMCAQLVKTNFEGADLTGAKVYGISAWDIELTGAIQLNLVITHANEPAILADDLEVAQFIHLLVSNQKMRRIIDTVTSKVVLILGNFNDERKPVLDKIRTALRTMNLVPVIFDFVKPSSKDLTGTVETLARMARFIIADLTDPSSIPHELAVIIPHLRTTPVLPIRLQSSKIKYSMFKDYQESYKWVLPTYKYKDTENLIASLPDIIAPANKMAKKFRHRSR